MEILEKAHAMELEGADVVHMEVGEPDFDTPEPVKEAAIRALRDGMTQYTHSLGIPRLRQAIAAHYGERYGVEVSPDNVLVTNGTSPAMVLIFAALLNPGEELILSNPCYACYPNILELVGGVPRYVEVFEEDGFKYRPAEIERKLGEGVKGVMINSPSNPTGIVLYDRDMTELVEAVSGRGFLISDEIYHGLVYEGRERSILEYTDRAFVLNGFSKLYAMTGWRLGYIISPPEFLRPLQKIQQNIHICANSFVQWAAVAALEETAVVHRGDGEDIQRAPALPAGPCEEDGFRGHCRADGRLLHIRQRQAVHRRRLSVLPRGARQGARRHHAGYRLRERR